MQGDREGEFSNAQALAATAASSNNVKVGKNIGIGEPMCVVLTLDVAADATDGDETYKAKIESDADSGFATPVQVGEEVSFVRGDAIGTRKIINIPPNVLADEWLRVKYTLGGTTPSMTVTARLMPLAAIQNAVFYPAGNTIS